MIESKTGQRIAGVVLLIISGGATGGIWYTALTEGYYYPKLAALAPALAVLSLALLLFPLDMEEFRAEHGVDRPQKLAHYPTEWKLMFVLALAAGLGNWLALSQ